MGEYADERIERLTDPDIFEVLRFQPRRKSFPALWTFPKHFFQTTEHITADGHVMRLEDMTARHRGNTVRLRARKLRDDPPLGTFSVTQFRIDMRGEFDDEITDATRDRHKPELTRLLELTPLMRRMRELGIE